MTAVVVLADNRTVVTTAVTVVMLADNRKHLVRQWQFGWSWCDWRRPQLRCFCQSFAVKATFCKVLPVGPEFPNPLD